MSNAIEFKNMILNRKGFKLGPINLEIPTGYVTAIVGPNGSGKTSMFRSILKQTNISSGEIHLFGERVDNIETNQTNERIGYLMENQSFFDDGLVASEKADFHRKWFQGWNENVYKNCLNKFGITDNIRFKNMSKGMRRKFDFTVALSHEPELLILDEPSSGLDPIAWRGMIDVINAYMDNGERTVLLATHIIDEVKRLADYIVFMVDGKILGIYEKDSLLQSWATFYIQADKDSEYYLHRIPGLLKHCRIGNDRIELTTKEALLADEYLKENNITVLNRQVLELDEILLQHMNEVKIFG